MQLLRIPAAVAVIAVAVATCGYAASTEKVQPPGSPAGIDPCTVLTEPEVVSLGASFPGTPVPGSADPACRFEHPEYSVTISVREGRDLDYWQNHREDIGLFQENGLGRHKLLQLIPPEQLGKGICNESLIVGSGSVNVEVAFPPGENPGENEVCKVAWAYATPIEAKLPLT